MNNSHTQISKRGKIANDMDRFSSLPDPILGHILTFLPAKNAVATSILSTRWKYVFLQVHEIKLDDVFLQNPQTHTSYLDYASRLLMLASVMRAFRLKSSNLNERSVANSWIRSSFTRNIQELDIKVDKGYIPVEIFTCNSLVVLKVEGHADADLEVPKLVSLSNLKVMKLKDLTVGDEDYPDWEISVGYPQLEDLQLLDLTMCVETLRISISTLQKLFVDVNCGLDFGERMVLNAPNLCHLEIDPSHLLLEPSSSDYHNSLLSACVRPLFGKLKFLEVRDVYGFEQLEKILNNAPNLERLVCDLWSLWDDDEDDDDDDGGDLVEYKNHRLREVEIRNFGNNDAFDSGLKMVLHLLKNGVTLKRMTIVDADGYDLKKVFQSAEFKKLLLQASCSPAVQLLHRSST